MINFEFKHPLANADHLGFLPHFASEGQGSVAEQFNRNYAHGGGWHPFEGFTMQADGSIVYPGDPPHRLLAEGKIGEEVIRVYESAWVAIIQPDGSYEISRMD